MHWSKSTRWLLRMSLGLTIATEAEFSLQRERVHNTIPKLYLCSDEHSVTSNVDDTVEWMLTLEHIVAMLLGVTILTTIIGNDGALPLPLHGRAIGIANVVCCHFHFLQPASRASLPPSLPPSHKARHSEAPEVGGRCMESTSGSPACT